MITPDDITWFPSAQIRAGLAYKDCLTTSTLALLCLHAPPSAITVSVSPKQGYTIQAAYTGQKIVPEVPNVNELSPRSQRFLRLVFKPRERQGDI